MIIDQFKHALTRRNLNVAWQDVAAGWKRWELWSTMALQDTRQRYRRSVIGPFWLTLSMGIFIGALGLLYAVIFEQELETYLPYVAAGFIVWGLVSSLILEGGNTFIANEGMIRQLPAPVSTYVYRMVWGNLIIFAHNILVFVAVAVWFQTKISWALVFVLPGLALIALNGVWMGLLLGLVSARFRDIPQLLASVVQVTFFLTPINWLPDMLSGRTFIVDWNPIYHLIELVRAPLLGEMPSVLTLVASVVVTILGWLLAVLLFAVYRWRIPYWL